jgi:hypothetical protein
LGDVEWRAEGPREWVLPGEVPLYGRDQLLPAPVRQGVSWARADAPALRPVPTAREQVLMTLASLIAAHWPVLSDNPTTWPETLCARFCRKFCSGGHEGAVAPVCGGD